VDKRVRSVASDGAAANCSCLDRKDRFGASVPSESGNPNPLQPVDTRREARLTPKMTRHEQCRLRELREIFIPGG
jgi:hypothetical protein